MPLAVDQGLGILVWSPLAGGLVSGKYRRDASPSGETRQLSGEWNEPPVRDREKLYDTIEVLVDVAGAHGASPAQVDEHLDRVVQLLPVAHRWLRSTRPTTAASHPTATHRRRYFPDTSPPASGDHTRMPSPWSTARDWASWCGPRWPAGWCPGSTGAMRRRRVRRGSCRASGTSHRCATGEAVRHDRGARRPGPGTHHARPPRRRAPRSCRTALPVAHRWLVPTRPTTAASHPTATHGAGTCRTPSPPASGDHTRSASPWSTAQGHELVLGVPRLQRIVRACCAAIRSNPGGRPGTGHPGVVPAGQRGPHQDAQSLVAAGASSGSRRSRSTRWSRGTPSTSSCPWRSTRDWASWCGPRWPAGWCPGSTGAMRRRRVRRGSCRASGTSHRCATGRSCTTRSRCSSTWRARMVARSTRPTTAASHPTADRAGTPGHQPAPAGTTPGCPSPWSTARGTSSYSASLDSSE